VVLAARQAGRRSLGVRRCLSLRERQRLGEAHLKGLSNGLKLKWGEPGHAAGGGYQTEAVKHYSSLAHSKQWGAKGAHPTLGDQGKLEPKIVGGAKALEDLHLLRAADEVVSDL